MKITTLVLTLAALSCLGFASQAFADTGSIQTFEQALKQDHMAFSSANNSIKTARIGVNIAQQRANAAHLAYEKAKQNWQNSSGGYWHVLGISIPNGSAGTGDPNLKRTYLAAKAANNTAKNELANAQKHYYVLQRTSAQLADQMTATNLNLAQTKQAFAALFKANGVMTEFNQLEQKAGSIDTALNLIDAKMDQAAVGAYLKDKMGMFVNSNLFCRAMNRCHTKAPNPIPNKYINQLFKGASNTTRRRESYYDIMHPPTGK